MKFLSSIQKGASTATLKLCIKDIEAYKSGKPFQPTKSRWRKRFRRKLKKLNP